MSQCCNDECVLETQGTNKYCSLKCRNVQVNKTRDYSKNGVGISRTRKKNLVKTINECRQCHAKISNRSKYCTVACSNIATKTGIYMSQETKEKHRTAAKLLWLSKEYRQKQADNNVTNNKRFSSKSEVEARDHFKSKFPEDGWTFGGALRCEDLYITRDLYSPSLKVCIEYDGIWHFKDIHGQLEDKQAKDKALELWCIKNDWRLIRIKDEIYLNNKQGVLKELEYFAYYSQETITKLY